MSTYFLASVSSLAEAQLAWAAGAEWLDLKQAAAGALGALDIAEIQRVVRWAQQLCPISVTLGDIPLQTEILIPLLQSRLGLGVNFIKIGLFPHPDMQTCLQALRAYSSNDTQFIAVLFADFAPDFTLLAKLAHFGFKGVMLDTADKTRGTLRTYLDDAQLQLFIQQAKQHRLMTGLAGSLRLEDIAGLLPLGADYLGFRGALCQQKRRTLTVDASQVAAIYREIHHSSLL